MCLIAGGNYDDNIADDNSQGLYRNKFLSKFCSGLHSAKPTEEPRWALLKGRCQPLRIKKQGESRRVRGLDQVIPSM